MKITTLGARGSYPVSGEQYTEFGGSTSCFMVSAGSYTVFLDAGSGLYHQEDVVSSTILLSHLHLDHLLGLPTYKGLIAPGTATKIYVPGGIAGLDDLYSPPYWPLHLTDYPGDVSMLTLPMRETDLKVINLGTESDPLILTHISGHHPGGCRVFKLTYQGETIVYATDYEHADDNESLIAFSEHADCLIYDGAYAPSEYAFFKGYGHSTPAMGAFIAKAAGVGRLVITHHAPNHDDEALRAMETEAKKEFANTVFAREDVCCYE